MNVLYLSALNDIQTSIGGGGGRGNAFTPGVRKQVNQAVRSFLKILMP
jgi:hypothetical protein